MPPPLREQCWRHFVFRLSLSVHPCMCDHMLQVYNTKMNLLDFEVRRSRSQGRSVGTIFDWRGNLAQRQSLKGNGLPNILLYNTF